MFSATANTVRSSSAPPHSEPFRKWLIFHKSNVPSAYSQSVTSGL